jgi:RNA polymerase sigma-70 factor (ECF subfamily)
MTVRRALLKLPQKQGQLLLLRHAGLSYKELAEALQVAPGSVGTLLARAEAAFERAYAEEER